MNILNEESINLCYLPNIKANLLRLLTIENDHFQSNGINLCFDLMKREDFQWNEKSSHQNWPLLSENKAFAPNPGIGFGHTK